jgi:hypothetical protein
MGGLRAVSYMAGYLAVGTAISLGGFRLTEPVVNKVLHIKKELNNGKYVRKG